MSGARERLLARYGTDRFLKTGHTLVEALGRYLDRCKAAEKSVDWKDPEELIALADGCLSGRGTEELAELFLANTHRLHSTHYQGHQVAVPVPESAAFELLGHVANQGCAVYEMGPFPVAIERAMSARLAAKIGWKKDFGYIATHGGTIANLTAILAARNHAFPGAWENGVPAGVKPVVLVTEDSHYSLSRALGISGLGTKAMRVGPVESTYRAAVAAGETPFCVVATAGRTATGSFDALRPAAELCRREKLWLHVDGAHGASVLFSDRHRSLVDGISLADSVTWDAHKLLGVPALCTFLFYREREKSYAPFRQDAPYLIDEEERRLYEYDCAHRTIECTKRSLAVSLWAAWSMYGEGHFGDLVDVTFAATRRFWELLRDASDFEPCHEPQSNILCFRYQGAEDQAAIRRRLLREGPFYLTTARLDGKMVLRVTVMNPFTEEKDFLDLMSAIRLTGTASLS